MKEIVGAGQQQVRFVWANVGAFHISGWTIVMTEAWVWRRDESSLVGHQSASPWDDEPRRPSHADKRRAWMRELLGEEIRAVLRAGASDTEIAATAERLLDLAALTRECRGKYISKEVRRLRRVGAGVGPAIPNATPQTNQAPCRSGVEY